MTDADFWSKSKVSVIGAGHWGTTLANVIAPHCAELRLWARNVDQIREMNATRVNPHYYEGISLHPRVQATHELERVVGGYADLVVWALPSQGCREMARGMAKHFTGRELLLHATKGVEEGSLKRISQILGEELACPRIGVISGPNLAHEIARGEPAATVVASRFEEVVTAGQCLMGGPKFRVYGSSDVVGVEWAGVLKNVLAIAAGVLDALKLGWNARAMLISRGLAEMVRFGTAMGADPATFLGLAGVGDLLATCSSPLSRNYRVGYRLAMGEPLDKILAELGSVAEGVRTTRSVWLYAEARKIDMPITYGVYELLRGQARATEILTELMSRPQIQETP